jgi:hypothetical protein
VSFEVFAQSIDRQRAGGWVSGLRRFLGPSRSWWLRVKVTRKTSKILRKPNRPIHLREVTATGAQGCEAASPADPGTGAFP